MYENWISIIWRRSIPVNSRTWAQSLFVISKPTCDKPKAEGRRPESASEASSIRPEVYSSRSEHLPEAPTCIRPRVHWPEVYSSIREVNWVYVKSRQVEENSRISPERVQKKSRKNPEKVQKKSRKNPEIVNTQAGCQLEETSNFILCHAKSTKPEVEPAQRGKKASRAPPRTRAQQEFWSSGCTF